MDSSATRKNMIRIANVYAPITLNSSWRTTIEEERTSRFYYQDTNFAFSRFRDQWINIWNVYTKAQSFSWLFSLPFRLVRGKFHLFVSGVRYPEGIITFVMSKLLRKPVIIRDTYWYWSNEPLLNSILWPISRFAARHANAFAVDSQRVRKFWILSGLSEKPIHLGHYYVSKIEISDRDLALAKRVRAESNARYVILYFGRLVKRKGVEYLIKAFSNLSREYHDIALLIVGDGPERSVLEKLCKDLGTDNVVFVGAVTEEDKPAYFLSGDVLVYPSVSLGAMEEWGLAVNEAMSLGKPVIVTNVLGSAYELVKPGFNGYVVPEKDVQAIYNAIKKLHDDPLLGTRMGENGRKTIDEDFTYENSSGIWLAVLRDTLLGKNAK